jgi:hypothetical protein
MSDMLNDYPCIVIDGSLVYVSLAGLHYMLDKDNLPMKHPRFMIPLQWRDMER